MSAPPIPSITGGASGPSYSGPQTQGNWTTGGLTVVKADGWVWAVAAVVALIVFLWFRKKK